MAVCWFLSKGSAFCAAIKYRRISFFLWPILVFNLPVAKATGGAKSCLEVMVGTIDRHTKGLVDSTPSFSPEEMVQIGDLKPFNSRRIDEYNSTAVVRLNKFGVKFEHTLHPSVLDGECFGNPKFERFRYQHRVFKITKDGLPPSRVRNSKDLLPFQRQLALEGPALIHPDLPDILAELDSRGYQFVVDTSLGHPRMRDGQEYFKAGILSPGKKLLAIAPDAPFHVVLHEFEHLKFEEEVIAKLGFDRIRMLADGPNFKSQVKALHQVHPLQGRAVELAKKGLSDLAIHETIAVEAELRALREAGVSKLSLAYLSRLDYALWHQIQGLTPPKFTGKLSRAQKTTLKRAIAGRLLFTNGIAPCLWELGRLGKVPIVVGGAGLYYQFFYNKKKNKVIVLSDDGQRSEVSLNEAAGKLTDTDVANYAKLVEKEHPRQSE